MARYQKRFKGEGKQTLEMKLLPQVTDSGHEAMGD